MVSTIANQPRRADLFAPLEEIGKKLVEAPDRRALEKVLIYGGDQVQRRTTGAGFAVVEDRRPGLGSSGETAP
jgi:hypothetical protein